MRYNSEALEIKVVISGNGLLFKGTKISLGLLTSAREKHALCRENHKLTSVTCQQTQIIESESLLSKPVFKANVSA